MILLKGARAAGLPGISDGTHDLVFSGSTISSFDNGTAKSTFEEVIDGRELIVAPGFVDMHSHSDLYRFRSTSSGFSLGDIPKLTQGCTFQVLGQDGYSAAPIRTEDKSDYSQFISGLDGSLPVENWNWSSFSEYVSANSVLNGTETAHLVGHSTIRRHVAGMQNRLLTMAELAQMKELLRLALRAGAAGLSTGLVYAPASYSNSAELYELASVLAEFDSVMFVHLRSESSHIIEAFEEVANACIEAGCRLHISHIKTAGADNWHLTPLLIKTITDYVTEKELRLTADLHPYIAGSTMASVFLPGWFQSADLDETLRRLIDREAIEQARLQILNDIDSWDNWWRFSSGWSGIRFTECHDKSLIGRPIDVLLTENEITNHESHEAFAWFFRVLYKSKMQASIISFNNNEENIASYLKLPYVSLCTDGLINPHGQPHPRTYGSFPRLFNRFVNELGVLDLETAIDVASVRGRSVIRNRTIKDFVIFDPLLLKDNSTFTNPTLLSSGIVAEYISGKWIDIQELGRSISND
jgi:N-acyl-D-amino-acid deacylase